MSNNINYHRGGNEASKAWFAYKAAAANTTRPAKSVVDFVAGWNAARQASNDVPSKAEFRAAALFEQAVASLQEYYGCLADQTLCLEFESAVKVPDTGNDQLDYENVRDQVEKLCKAQPFGGNDPGI